MTQETLPENSLRDRQILMLEREMLRRKSENSLLSLTQFVDTKYYTNWHHEAMASEIQDFLEDPEQKRMMLFVPPQHGKSHLASYMTPAYCLGKYPDWKIAIASYSGDLSKNFAGQVQQLVQSEDYQSVFPNVKISGPASEFKNLSGRGSVKAVGVTGGLSGRGIDLAIIDDPVKDSIEANSITYRERVWNWYTSVIRTRLHNDSKVIIIMTRWHEDDLAGKLLEEEGEKWKVVKFAAIKESDYTHPLDPREIGESLWESRHSLEKLNEDRALSEGVFQSLYQQNPTVPDGDIIKDSWFEYCEAKEVPNGIIWNLWVDGAYTESTKNDPTGLMVAGYWPATKTLYIKHAHDAYLIITKLADLVEEYAALHQLGSRSRAYYEPKASGKSLRQLMKDKVKWLQSVEIKNRLVQEGKMGRATVAAPKLEAGRVVLVKGTWNERFKKQLTGFPKAKHDEYIDLLGYATYHHFDTRRPGIRTR